MTDDLFNNLLECNRRTAVDESINHKVELLYEIWNHIPADNDYRIGVRAGILEAISVITGDYYVYFRNALVPDVPDVKDLENCLVSDIRELSDRVSKVSDQVKDMDNKTIKALEELQYGSWDK